MVKWLRLHASNAGGPSSMPGWETRFHMPQLRPSTAKLINIKKIEKNPFSQQTAFLWSVTPCPPPQERRVRLAFSSACRSSGWLGALLFLAFRKDFGLKVAAILFFPFCIEGSKLQCLISCPRGSLGCRAQINSLFL